MWRGPPSTPHQLWPRFTSVPLLAPDIAAEAAKGVGGESARISTRAGRYGASVGSVEQRFRRRCSGPDLSGVATFDALLDAAIEQAKAEGNLSRANVQIRSSYRAS
jgi:hypothetical protein